MKTILQICVCALLAALTGLVVYTIELVRTATAAVSTLPGELIATRTAVVDEARAARKDVLARSEREVAALRRDVMAEAGEIRAAADRRVGDTLARADVALGTAEELRHDLLPVLAAAQSTLHNADRTVVDLHPQLLGLVAASKVTAGETAQTMRDIRFAVPNFIEQGQHITTNVNTATAEFSGRRHQFEPTDEAEMVRPAAGVRPQRRGDLSQSESRHQRGGARHAVSDGALIVRERLIGHG